MQQPQPVVVRIRVRLTPETDRLGFRRVRDIADALEIISDAPGNNQLLLPCTNSTTLLRPSRSFAGLMSRQRRFFISAGLRPVRHGIRITLQVTVHYQTLEGLSASAIHLRSTMWSLRYCSSVNSSRSMDLSLGRSSKRWLAGRYRFLTA